MGTVVTIGELDYDVSNFSVEEESSPLSPGDTTGSVGTSTFDLVSPDRYLQPDHPMNLYGNDWLIDQPVYVRDGYYGSTQGTVLSLSDEAGSDAVTVTCVSRLAELLVYNVQAEPFVGTLGGAFEYYLSLAGVTTSFFVDETVSSRAVKLRGFNGDLWTYLKRLAAAQDCDISLVSNIILLRPVRVRIAERGLDISRQHSNSGGSLAQTVEVYWYDTAEITDELVYPSGGWTPEVEILNVNAGETAEYQLSLDASLTSIQAPTMQTFVAEDYESSSVYTIVADDGFPVPTAQWHDNGGAVSVTLNPDTTSLTVTLTGASNIPVATGGYSKAFSLALASDTSGSRYSTLRIVGTGVRYTRQKRTFRTGVPASKTSTVIGETIDNVFITDIDTLFRAGARAAARWTGLVPEMTGTVTAINRRGDTGVAVYPTYGQVESSLASAIGGTPTYAQVQTYYTSTQSLSTYAEVKQFWFDTAVSDYSNQAFGNVNGARVYDHRTRRWYRIRSGTLTPEGISVTAEDDLLYSDVEAYFSGQTYTDVQTVRSGLTYQQERMVGLRG